jgi:DNA processing protein
MKIERDYFWFRLFKAHRIGPKSLISIAKILEKEDRHPEMLPRNQSNFSTQFPELSKILNGKIRAEDSDKAYTEYEQLKTQGVEFIYPMHPDFPPHLLEVTPMLFIKGKRKLLTSDGVAIVGSRNVSETGVRVVRKLAADLANAGLNVVSGYAKGVDSEAHLGALDAEGTTTIVLSYGIKELRQKSAFKAFDWQQNVLAVSQFDPGVKWLARNAMARNKLVCALSKTVVVIESGVERDAQGKMSGTFNTAQTALSMNLPLFVLNPKCFDNPPKGNADLIDLGGECFDPDGGAEAIVKSISAAKMESSPVEQQASSEQLEIRF